MEKKIITIKASPAILNTTGLILIPVSTQKLISESLYLVSIREVITICLS